MYIAINFENIGFPGDNGTNFDIISLNVWENYEIPRIFKSVNPPSVGLPK